MTRALLIVPWVLGWWGGYIGFTFMMALCVVTLIISVWPSNRSRHKTPRQQKVLLHVAVFFVPCVLVKWFLNVALRAHLHLDWIDTICLSYLSGYAWCGWMWFWCNVINAGLFGQTPEWKKFRAAGLCPYFDDPNGWLNGGESLAVCLGGQPEPVYGDFVPPDAWCEWQCRSCGARLPGQHCTCWHCGEVN